MCDATAMQTSHTSEARGECVSKIGDHVVCIQRSGSLQGRKVEAAQWSVYHQIKTTLKLSDIKPPSRDYLEFMNHIKNLEKVDLERFRQTR